MIRERQHVVWLALVTITLSVGWFLLDGNIRMNLADEGIIWSAPQAVREGQVPLRDFESYDPGRYVWTAGWSHVLGEGVVSIRLASVFFQCMGVLAGLLAARRLSRQPLFLGCVALLFCAWMHPRYKVYEQSIALMAVYAGVLLLERPSLWRHWWVGIFGGLCAFVGRNHGAYHVLAFGLLIAWAARDVGWHTWLRRSFVWGIGLLVGYLPQWVMFIFVPGYFRAYIPYISSIFSHGTNLSKSVPWPWLAPANAPLWWRLAAIAEGCFYVALPVFLVLAAIRAIQLRQKRIALHPVLIAAACVSVPYTHYVFSRADIVHLTHGAPTMVLGAIALGFSFPGRWARVGHAVAVLLLATSVLANLFLYNITFELTSPPKSLFAVPVKGERMVVGRYHASVMANAQRLANELAKPDEAILFLPHMPALYPFTGRWSPTKQLYFVLPASAETDRALIAEIEAARVQWVMMQDYPLDGRDDLRFRYTNPIVFDHFLRNFEPVPFETLPLDMVVLRRRSSVAVPEDL